MTDLHITANHAHLFPAGSKDRAQVPYLKELMNECGIERAVCFTCFRDQYARSGLPGDPVKWLYDEIKDDPSLIGFGTVEFSEEPYEIRDQVRRIADFGFKGIKIHPAYQEINIMSHKACEVYKEAERLGLFLSFHTGLHWYPIKDYHPLLFDEVAWNFPELKFSMEHIGGYHFFNDALAVICNSKRNSETETVFAGWTSVNMPDDGIPDTWALSDEQLLAVIKQTGEKRSVFGLDFPYKNAEYTKKAINRILSLPISDEAKRGILGGNLSAALGLDNE